MSKDIMVIDYDKCVRYARGDERFKESLVPYRCPSCAGGVPIMSEDAEGNKIRATVRYLTPGSFSAKLAPVGKPPVCMDHSAPVVMERV